MFIKSYKFIDNGIIFIKKNLLECFHFKSYLILQFLYIKKSFMQNIEEANKFKALGNQAFKNKDYQKSIQYFTKAIENNPNDHTFYSNRSGSYININKYQEALQDANKCIQINNKWPRGYERKGKALVNLDRIDQAIQTYRQGLKYDSNNVGLINGLKQAQDKGKTNPLNQQYLGAMMKLLQNEQTKQYLNDPQFMQKVQAVIKNPQYKSYYSHDPKVKKALQVIGDISANSFNFEDLMKNMSKQKAAPKQQSSKMEEQPIIRQEPKKQEKQEKKPQPKMQVEVSPAEQLKNKGNLQFKNKNFAKAIEHYNQAINLNSQQPLFYNNLAAAHIEAGQFENAFNVINKAEMLFEQGKCKDPIKKAKVYARKGSLLTKQEKYAEAIQAYNKSLIQDGVAKVRDQLKKVKKLQKTQQQLAYINPQLAEKACEEGNAYFKQGKYPDARTHYEQAIKRNPNGAKYYSNLGTVYIKLMQWQRAKQNFDKCLEKDPNYIKAYGKKGDCHYALKQFHKALQTYEQGLKLDPNNQICQSGVQKTQMAIYSGGGASQQQKQERAHKAMADPQIQAILNTPQVRNALNDLQENPAAIQNIMKNPSLAQKINKLVEAGVIGMG